MFCTYLHKVTFIQVRSRCTPVPTQAPHHRQASYMYTFRIRSSFVSPVSRSAMLRTAQPKGRRYWTLQAFFFSPAPIRPIQLKSKHDSWRYLIRCILNRDTATRQTIQNITRWWKWHRWGATEDSASLQDPLLQSPPSVTLGKQCELWASAAICKTWRLELIPRLGTTFLLLWFKKGFQRAYFIKVTKDTYNISHFLKNSLFKKTISNASPLKGSSWRDSEYNK